MKDTCCVSSCACIQFLLFARQLLAVALCDWRFFTDQFPTTSFPFFLVNWIHFLEPFVLRLSLNLLRIPTASLLTLCGQHVGSWQWPWFNGYFSHYFIGCISSCLHLPVCSLCVDLGLWHVKTKQQVVYLQPAAEEIQTGCRSQWPSLTGSSYWRTLVCFCGLPAVSSLHQLWHSNSSALPPQVCHLC